MPKFNILRSQRALSAIGSGLVLITYVVHDGFRESLKDLVSSMQNAENVYLSRATVLAVLREYAAGNDASGETPFKHAKYFWTSFEASRDLIDHLPQADQTRFRAGLERLTKEFTHAAAESGALALDHLINQGAKKGNSSNLGKLTNKTEFDLLLRRRNLWVAEAVEWSRDARLARPANPLSAGEGFDSFLARCLSSQFDEFPRASATRFFADLQTVSIRCSEQPASADHSSTKR